MCVCVCACVCVCVCVCAVCIRVLMFPERGWCYSSRYLASDKPVNRRIYTIMQSFDTPNRTNVLGGVNANEMTPTFANGRLEARKEQSADLATETLNPRAQL